MAPITRGEARLSTSTTPFAIREVLQPQPEQRQLQTLNDIIWNFFATHPKQ